MANDIPDAPKRVIFGLSMKLITMIIAMIMVVEVLIYLPSVANFRINWMDDRVHIAGVAAQVIETVPDTMDLTPTMIGKLLSSAEAEALVVRTEGQSQLIERPDVPMPVAAYAADTRERAPLDLIAGALEILFFGSNRTMRVIGVPMDSQDVVVEVLINEALLRQELLIYSRNIFWLSLLVASFTSFAIFLFLNGLLVRPISRLTSNMVAFRQNPDDANKIIVPSDRRDEVGVAERELAAMETNIFTLLKQKQHLADLGLAVAKINHDLRNTLGAAQLLSDQVANLDDPHVQRLAPRLVNTLDRAINFCQSVLDYGRHKAVPPKFERVDLRALLDESATEAAVRMHPEIDWRNQVPDNVIIRVDPDQIARVFTNLFKNAREALEVQHRQDGERPWVAVELETTPDQLRLTVEDNGPGLSPRAKDNLFRAFEGSGRAGGTGLGLAIAKELAEAHGGTLAYVDVQKGTKFEISLPR
ncbi:sensor histidine kinase [Maritalea mediterranea]|uniref:histidine kinase n=1 Tax=Maritalea mediterranea TaxID=2909667 RepID=A0ABS9E3S9_9HYPH|nr:HAMP domain-containing sensor histidine kinase [Maritalea mediterranea]MCF4097511.1 HAMP domain-containing histidine kinase [Maritalea mediterranea]